MQIDDAEFRAAVDNDLFARGLGKAALQLQLLLLSSNQRASGYNVCEIGAGSGQFTREVSHNNLHRAIQGHEYMCMCMAAFAVLLGFCQHWFGPCRGDYPDEQQNCFLRIKMDSRSDIKTGENSYST